MYGLEWLDNFRDADDASHFIDDQFTDLYTILLLQLYDPANSGIVQSEELSTMITSAENLTMPQKPNKGWEAFGPAVVQVVRRLETLALVASMKKRGQ